ncbi:hypothetical protein RQP54_14110 [Curvibacter sp. APW13]|uniref:hypothetical protein n=1 Tax=Curvibacter sp. APW13 TaxID=3077236 RepID=UPI0028E07E97|nr:hypothetical protein [Curvibacter sp. APW13]MDT8992002.1 hypothetical protein [Curvibacter sp. APW13]
MRVRGVHLALLLAPTLVLAQSNPLTGFFRSITGALGGTTKPAPQTPTATLGIRGMDDASAAAPAAGAEAPAADIRLLESWAVGRTEAESAAARRGLSARVVELAGAPASKPAPAPAGPAAPAPGGLP